MGKVIQAIATLMYTKYPEIGEAIDNMPASKKAKFEAEFFGLCK